MLSRSWITDRCGRSLEMIVGNCCAVHSAVGCSVIGEHIDGGAEGDGKAESTHDSKAYAISVATSSAGGRSRQSFAQYQMKSAPDGILAGYTEVLGPLGETWWAVIPRSADVRAQVFPTCSQL